MGVMKKITLASMMIFVTILIVSSIGSYYMHNNISNNDNIMKIVQTTPTKIIQNEALNNITSLSTKDYINSPGIDIDSLVTNLTKPKLGTFTMEEVSKHNSRNDCYLVINNNVYDVSSYIGYHPGGSKTITSHCGKEVTGIFASIHSNRAWDLLKKYKIGVLISTNIRAPQSEILSAIYKGLQKANPTAEIINVKQKKGLYIAKIIKYNKLFEVHINNKGLITNEEIEDEEQNWSLWENDKDDD